MGNQTSISKSSVSRICGGIDEVVTTFMNRPLEHTWFGYLYLDATYLDVRRHGRSSPRPPSSRSVFPTSDGARSSA